MKEIEFEELQRRAAMALHTDLKLLIATRREQIREGYSFGAHIETMAVLNAAQTLTSKMADEVLEPYEDGFDHNVSVHSLSNQIHFYCDKCKWHIWNTMSIAERFNVSEIVKIQTTHRLEVKAEMEKERDEAAEDASA